VQGAHTPPAQIGAAAGQVALSRHPTHVPIGEHKVRVGSPSAVHWAEVVHAAQVPTAQIGNAAGQVALVRHCTHL